MMKIVYKLLFVLVCVALQIAPANAEYCTDSNWDRAQKLYKKVEDRYNVQVNEFNEQVYIYNSFDFIYSQIPESTTNEKLYRQLQTKKYVAESNSNALEVIRIKLIEIRRTTVKSKNMWSKLAEYCYDEDRYDDYKSGRDNMRISIGMKEDIDDFNEKIQRFKKKYNREITSIQSVVFVEQQVGSELTCNEAWQKTNHIEKTDDSFSYFQNFLESEHHSNSRHSLNLRPISAAKSEYFDVNNAEKAEYVSKLGDALNLLIAGFTKIIDGESNHLNLGPNTSATIIEELYQQNRDDFPLELTHDLLRGGVELNPTQVSAAREFSIQARNELMEFKKTFLVILDRDADKNKRVYFQYGESCTPGVKAQNKATVIDGLSLSFTYVCAEDAAFQMTYLYAIPDTQEAMGKLVTTFKKKVWVDAQLLGIQSDYLVKFWANGFTRTWNGL
ncbi:hypothetical protein [Vibrio sp. VB16]|uniref:hypothetical protein n=1 Tax=Vibrio sp. VB16 TaxID=2785746 RepID=UPI00189E465B|nr:hypothetical protein [Vibrio sp. VB16]UGA55416.1 hypothetical protein IUZ65_003415 [Vibrio sp. VB16]